MNKIALNVLEGVTRKVNIDKAMESGNVGLIVFTGSNVSLKERLMELKELKNKSVMFSLGFSFMASRLLDLEYIIDELDPIEVYREEDMLRLGEIVNRYQYIIGPNITVNTLSKVALGIVDSFIPALIWTYLYNGRKVYLDFHSTKSYMGSPLENKIMEGIIDKYIAILKSMGAIEVIKGSYSEIFNRKVDEFTGRESSKEDYSLKKVITEKDIQNIPRGKKIILPKGTIVTPLAKDTAKLMGIVFEIEK